MLTALLHMERQERRTDESTSAAVEWERRGAREIQGYSDTQRRELYTTGCSEARGNEMCGREVVPELLLRC